MAAGGRRGSARASRPATPVEIDLSVRVRLGDAPEQWIDVMRHRRVRMSAGLLHDREAILRRFLSLLAETAAACGDAALHHRTTGRQ